MPEALHVRSLLDVHVADADERRPRAVHHRREAGQVHERGRAEAEHGGERHAVDVAGGARLGGVRVGVGVEPDEAELLLPPVEVPGEAGDRPHRHRVVAAEHDRRRSRLERLAHAVAQRLADLEDLLQVLEARVAGPWVSGIFTCRSPQSSTSWPSCGDLRVHLRHAERGGAHVDAAAAGAEVEGNADEGHASLRHALLFRRRRAAP